MSAPFVTGGTGFLGSRLVDLLAAGSTPVRALTRSARTQRTGVEWIGGSILDPESYAARLDGVGTVFHLAAATGRATATDHARVNAGGTKALVAACRRAGVQRIIFVSSIAVTFPDIAAYPYARAKADAERVVRDGGVAFTIVRPTIIAGPGSPVLAGLRKLAALPVVPVLGPGTARVQPIWVDDVAVALVRMAADPAMEGETIDLGGPTVLTMRELLVAMHRVLRGREPRCVHVPLAPLRAGLAVAERFVGPVLPLTAGQLTSFTADGVATRHARLGALLPDPMPLDEMLRRSLAA